MKFYNLLQLSSDVQNEKDWDRKLRRVLGRQYCFIIFNLKSFENNF